MIFSTISLLPLSSPHPSHKKTICYISIPGRGGPCLLLFVAVIIIVVVVVVVAVLHLAFVSYYFLIQLIKNPALEESLLLPHSLAVATTFPNWWFLPPSPLSPLKNENQCHLPHSAGAYAKSSASFQFHLALRV